MEHNQSLLITAFSVSELKSLFRNELETFFEKQKKTNLNTAEEDKLLTIKEVADLIKMSIPSIYRFCGNKDIPHLKVRGKLLFQKKEIIKWAMEGRRKTLKEIHQAGETWLGELGQKKAINLN